MGFSWRGSRSVSAGTLMEQLCREGGSGLFGGVFIARLYVRKAVRMAEKPKMCTDMLSGRTRYGA